MSVQATFAATLVDEWVCLGVTDAVVCPGSRSTPLALALAERLRVHVRLDERSAGFFAIGLALATERPVVVCVTSGTAAAELHPAVVEAHHANVPLIVCTADRPPELLDTGASQTIDQIGLYTTSTRWATAPGVPEDSHRAAWRPLAARAYAEATSGPQGPGPVHVNLAFREPLTGQPESLPPGPGPRQVKGHGSGETVRMSTELFGERGVFVVGGPTVPDPKALLDLGGLLGWPIVADPRSGCRVPGTISTADTLARAKALPHSDTVVLIGSPWLSRALSDYVAEAARDGATVIVVDPWGRWPDPTRSATEFHRADIATWVAAAISASTSGAGKRKSGAGPGWLRTWQALEDQARVAVDDFMAPATAAISEPAVARLAYRHAAATGSTLFVSASMPMRDLEWFAEPQANPPRVLANRGANGIDGVVSSALGAAASGSPVFALLGDLAFLHDVSGLVDVPQVPCTFVVPDNRGGGIFSFLPQAGTVEEDTFEQLFGTPPRTDIGHVARAFGLHVTEVSTLEMLEQALSEAGAAQRGAPAEGAAAVPRLIRVAVPSRRENVALHDAINEAVRLALK